MLLRTWMIALLLGLVAEIPLLVYVNRYFGPGGSDDLLPIVLAPLGPIAAMVFTAAYLFRSRFALDSDRKPPRAVRLVAHTLALGCASALLDFTIVGTLIRVA